MDKFYINQTIVLIFCMDLQSLKRSFLAAFPVIGPHADIEAELMLEAGYDLQTWHDRLPRPRYD